MENKRSELLAYAPNGLKWRFLKSLAAMTVTSSFLTQLEEI